MAKLLTDRPPREYMINSTPVEIGTPNEEVEVIRTEKPKSLESYVIENYINADGTNTIDDIQAAMTEHQEELSQLKETILVLEEGPPEEENANNAEENTTEEGDTENTEG